MDFRTPIEPISSKYKINHQDRLVLIGSCFAQEIGEKLGQVKIPTLVNPFGILFNPVSIANCLDRICRNEHLLEQDLDIANNKWFSFTHHGSFSNIDQQQCLLHINNSIEQAHYALKEATFLLLTLGSSIAYRHRQRNYIVGNCHKIHSAEFETQMLSSQESITFLLESLQKVRQINPKIVIILTVSPVRYIKYKLTENSLSKANLIVAAHCLTEKLSNCQYFPSYEILVDDLRDYRFYKSDMIHPNDLAVEYIWQQFSKTYFEPNTVTIATKVKEIVLASQHVFKQSTNEEVLKFKEAQLKKIEQINSAYPFLDLKQEKKYFNNLSIN